MNKKQYYIYIMTNQSHTVRYTGVTNDLAHRVLEHRSGKGGGFSDRYKLYKLVYYEAGDDISTAILREKQLTGSRKNKIDLINSINPGWEDLFEKYYGKL